MSVVPVPCAVVVDHRNLLGQARKVFGAASPVSVTGIAAALAPYGFDVQEVYVGMATKTISNAPAPHLADMLSRNVKAADALRAQGATVMEGNLVSRDQEIEEKQVDVLCAIRMADLADRILTGISKAKCIVAISEDMDLAPAYQFAKDRGVPLFCAAFDTVHTRAESPGWLILTEAALERIVPPRGRMHGFSLRTKMAAILHSVGPVTPYRWDYGHKLRDGRVVMRRSFGDFGIWTPPPGRTDTRSQNLFICGVAMEPHSMRFPYYELSSSPPPGPSGSLVIGTVLYWVSPTRVRVSTPFGDATLACSPGLVQPGQTVSIFRSTVGPDTATYLVGGTSAPTYPRTWTASEPAAMATITRLAEGGSWHQGVLEDGCAVRIHAKLLPSVEVGSHVVVSVVGCFGATGSATAMPLTAPLCC